MTDALPLPAGVGVALVTMFGDDGRPDVAATVERARGGVALGLSSVLVAGTTGEAWRLSPQDRISLASAVKDALPTTPVIVGTGARSAAEGLETTAKVAAGSVADALLVLSPGDAEPAPFYGALRREVGDVAVLAYHNPAVSHPGIDAAVVPDLDVDGIKDSSGDTNRLAALVELGVRIYVGSPTQLVVAGGCGAAGALLALANIAPGLCIAAWNGDLAAQRELFSLHVRSTADFPGFLKRSSPDAGGP